MIRLYNKLLLDHFRDNRQMAFLMGPHIRSIVSERGTERWFYWEGRIRGEVTLVGRVKAHLDWWRVISADVNVIEPFNHSNGIDGGLTLPLGTAPLALSLRYRSESATLGGGARTESVEQIALALHLGRF